MLSVLIPVFNYDITDLVFELHQQLTENEIAFEIIAVDDGSNEEFTSKNKDILKHPFYEKDYAAIMAVRCAANNSPTRNI